MDFEHLIELSGSRTKWVRRVALGVVALIVLVIVLRSYRETYAYDFSIYYHGAGAAWRNGDPYATTGWVGSPFVAMLLAPITRIMPLHTAAWWVTLANMLVIVGGAVAIWVWTRDRTREWFAWLLVLGWVGFAPVASATWWKQLELVPLGLAALGFLQVRTRRPWIGGVLIGLSVAIKPMVLLVPLALLLWRSTRKAGTIAVGSVIAFTAAGEAFLAWRAHDVALLSPFTTYDRWLGTISKPSNPLVCHPGNISPGATLCRLAGPGDWGMQRIVILAGVAVIAACATR